MPSLVCSSHRDHLTHHGYVILKGVIPKEVLTLAQQVLSNWAEEMIARWLREGLLTRPPNETDFRKRLLTAWQQAGRPHHERSPRRELVHLAPERLFRILSHPKLIDLAAELLDADHIVSHEIWNSRPKAPQQHFTDTPWHQDAQYFPEQTERRMVNLWFPLHRVDAQSSCLAVAPQQHTKGLYPSYGDSSGFIGLSPDAREDLHEVPVPLTAGDALAFTNMTPHRAMPNTSDSMRWSLDLRFAAHGDEDRWPLGQGIVARHSDPGLCTSLDAWRGAWA
ncbi:MAG: phytanoyl-CoA dioxygenase family protein [Planctomycetota bacterium]|jgi:phytanoyl-CoA hydroxylase|nr:phytanoyl-CoA dioxygenase family protein [Planctomycetota bacterium]